MKAEKERTKVHAPTVEKIDDGMWLVDPAALPKFHGVRIHQGNNTPADRPPHSTRRKKPKPYVTTKLFVAVCGNCDNRVDVTALRCPRCTSVFK